MSTKLANDPQTEAAQKAYADEKKAADASRAEYASRMKGKPTPTQEENDLAACGAHFLEHEPDGSDPDPSAASAKSLEASPARPQSYQTRSTHARSSE